MKGWSVCCWSHYPGVRSSVCTAESRVKEKEREKSMPTVVMKAASVSSVGSGRGGGGGERAGSFLAKKGQLHTEASFHTLTIKRRFPKVVNPTELSLPST